MEKLIFATNNKHKLAEISKALEGKFRVVSLADVELEGDIPETENTLQGNALLKARFIHALTGANVFADDTGLEVEALGGAPGVYSARFAGEHASDQDNVAKLLLDMSDREDRKARFRTVIALIINQEEHLFDGVCNGVILTEPQGDGGFGYDPIFRPDESDRAFAEMTMEEKNEISHRGRATRQLVEFLTA